MQVNATDCFDAHVRPFVILSGAITDEVSCGEGGIRTLGSDCSEQRFSRPPRSAALAPLLLAKMSTIYVSNNATARC
jgi:hypothetical protein